MGFNGLYVGVPCKLGARSWKQIIEINLTSEERIALQKAPPPVQELINVLGAQLPSGLEGHKRQYLPLLLARAPVLQL
ncbi:MAG: hypothetical protein WKF84_27475 [Pyrinomonadaceae bacterium]